MQVVMVCPTLAAVACLSLISSVQAFLPSHAIARSKGAVLMKGAGENSQQGGVDRRSMMRSTVSGGLGVLSLMPSIASGKGVKRVKAPPVTLPSGVIYQVTAIIGNQSDMAIGSGATPSLGDRVAVHYSLYYNGFEVESSRDSSGLAARPFGFNWGTKEGTGAIVKGVQEGMAGMQVGGRRKITIPPALAFGKKGLPPFIPPGATVLFDVSIWSIKPAGVNANLTLPGQQNYF